MPFAGRIFGARAVASPDIAEMALRTSYPVALGMIMVVLSFGTTLGYSHFLLQPVDERALSIVEHESPSLQHLANVRVGLARLGKDVPDFVVAEGPNRSPIGQGIDARRARIKPEFRLYRALPTSVEAYHGRLGVRSRSRKGSVFWFELPKAPLPHDEHVGRARRDARLS